MNIFKIGIIALIFSAHAGNLCIKEPGKRTCKIKTKSEAVTGETYYNELINDPWKSKLAYCLGIMRKITPIFWLFKYDEAFSKQASFEDIAEELKNILKAVFKEKKDHAKLKKYIDSGVLPEALDALLKEKPKNQWKIARFFGKRTFFEKIEKSFKTSFPESNIFNNEFEDFLDKENDNFFEEMHDQKILIDLLKFFILLTPDGIFNKEFFYNLIKK